MKIVLTNPVFGKNLQYLRKQYSLSRRALAKLLDVSVRQIRQLEAGKWPVSGIVLDSRVLFRIGAVFDMDTNCLLAENTTQ